MPLELIESAIGLVSRRRRHRPLRRQLWSTLTKRPRRSGRAARARACRAARRGAALNRRDRRTRAGRSALATHRRGPPPAHGAARPRSA
nr:hypothetical protein [Burkholderia thailandensis]